LAGSAAIASFLTEPVYEPEATQDLVNFAIDIQRNGKAEATITSPTRFLRQLEEKADLKNPEQVKTMMKDWNAKTTRAQNEANSRQNSSET
jgi:hypothetical protein